MKQFGINLTYSCNRNCDFCFAKGFLKKWPKEISLEKIESAFKWLAKQEAKPVISFLGGEPTLFSQINPTLYLAEKYDFKVIFYTNGIFDIDKVNIDSPSILLFTVNLSPPQKYSSWEMETLFFNLRVLKRRFKKVGLRFNITSPNISYRYLIDTCKRLNIDRVEASIAFPSIFNKNKYVKKENLKRTSRYVLQLVKDLVKNNIQILLACPLLPCFFTKKERKFLIENAEFHGICNIEKKHAVTPNLTVLPCSALAIEGPSLKSFKKEEEIFDYYKKLINKLKWEMDLFPECKDCVFKKERKCQGSCLIYKFLQAKEAGDLTDMVSRPVIDKN